MKLNPLYIVPARGGSKGIPRKNIKKLAGKPLIQWTIDVARRICEDPRHIILSTDDEEIASVAEACGLPVPYRRPASLATDTAGSREMMIDAMDWAIRQDIHFNCVVLLQPTSPLRTARDVLECMKIYAEQLPDMVVSVTESADNPYYNCFTLNTENNDALQPVLHAPLLTRRQDAPPTYALNGAVYVINPVSLRRMSLGMFPTRLPYVMPRERSVDLDTPLDWLFAEVLMRMKK